MGKIIGGLCFYEIEPHHCVSIIYFAVSSKFQVKGYGSYLMNHFKCNLHNNYRANEKKRT